MLEALFLFLVFIVFCFIFYVEFFIDNVVLVLLVCLSILLLVFENRIALHAKIVSSNQHYYLSSIELFQKSNWRV